MALEIPKEDTGAIAEINSLSNSSLDKLIAAISVAPVVASPAEMADHVAKQLPGIPRARLVKLLETLYTLYHIRDLSGVSPARFLEDLIDGIQNNPNLKSVKDRAKLRIWLERVLGIETLKTVSKAARLQRDGERLFCTSKILSDVRPVFGSNPSAPPLGAVLTHTLRIGYHEGSQHKEFHVVLDSEDLVALNNSIIRALNKDKSLCKFLDKSKLPNLG